MIKTFPKILWCQFLVPYSEHLLVSNATLLWLCALYFDFGGGGGGWEWGILKRQNSLSMTKVICRWPLMQIAFFWEVSNLCTVRLTVLFNSLIKVLSVLSVTCSFWSFIVPCFSLILLLPSIVSSERLFRYGTSISHFQIYLVLGSFLVNISSTALR